MLNFVVFVLIACGQVAIFMTIRANSMELSSSKDSTSRDSVIARRLSTVVLSDFLCWFPICVIGALVAIGKILFIHGIKKSMKTRLQLNAI